MKRNKQVVAQTYENRIVAFIDILGFSSIIKQSTIKSNVVSLGNLTSALSFLHKHFNELELDFGDSSLQLSQFSDSIVISVLEDTPELIIMCKNLKYAQIHLVNEYNILIRGGIVKGPLIHNNDLLLGPAMINAYNLESKCALSPRIVIDPKVKWKYDQINKSIHEKEKVLKKDFDGTYYIDYFNDSLDFYAGDEEVYFQQLCNIIKSNINNSDISIRMKYLWMREKLKGCKNYLKYEHIYKNIMTTTSK